MSEPAGVEVLTDNVLEVLYDSGSLQRGRKYAHEHRVNLIDQEAGGLKAVVVGSGRNTYLVRLKWQIRASGVGMEDDCSCPLGGACKHCVATILTARAAEQAESRTVTRARSDWRNALAGIVDTERAATARAPLALQVALSQPPPSRLRSTPPPSVTIRPMRMGKRDRWIKSGVSWGDFSAYGSLSQRDLDPRHTATVRAMAAGARRLYYSSGNGPVALAEFGPEVWRHLEQAIDAGVILIDADGDAGGIILADDPATVAVDLTSVDDDGTVAFATRLVVAGHPLVWDAGSCVLIGGPPHGLAWRRPDGSLLLAPLDDVVHPDLARLITAPPLLIPPDDVDELLDTYEPHLSRWAAVESTDASVTITTSAFVSLVFSVTRTALDTATFTWHARYRRGDRVSDRRLFTDDGPARDIEAERCAIDDLELPTELTDSLSTPDGRPRNGAVAGVDTVSLLNHVVPWFTGQAGVEVVVTDATDEVLPALRQAESDPLVSLEVADAENSSDGTDWFDLTVEVSVDGEEIPFAMLFTVLNTDEPVLILPSGTWLSLDRPEFTRLKTLIEEARGLADETRDDKVRINRFQAGWWDELAELGVLRAQSDRWAASVASMRDLAAPSPVTPAAGLEAKLRPYQQQGLDWLAFLHRNAIGGILADDMGLGKTIQALALCLHVRATKPEARFLVVAPTSVVANWAHEADRFAPELTSAVIHATGKRRGTTLADEVDDADLVVTSYALFRLEFEAYAALDWEVAFIDEAQFVKNHQGKTYQCVRRLDAVTKVAMTGTPMENSLMDLWSLLSIVAPGLYPDPQKFSEVYRKPIEKGEAPELLGTLRRRVAPLMRRRTKDAVLDDLPPKIEQTIEVELGAKHAKIYQTQLQRQRQRVLGLVGDMQRNRFEIFKALTLLRQLSLDPGLVDPEHDSIGSAKLDRLVDDLTQVLAEGHRALVFSQFTRYLARVRERLEAAGIAYAYLDGRTRNRDRAISSFTDGDVPVFVISLKAGGVGLNLTRADYCFVLDPWWNPAVETQAVDRAHRIGQTNPVVVYRYVSTGTIEEKVMELKARKAALFSDVIDADGALAGALTESDIRGLLDPI